MEIMTIVLEGALTHRDSMGNGSVMRVGDIQRMSAGTGVQHSEFNASDEDPVRFLQVWIEPSSAGLEPSYDQLYFVPEERADRLQLVASGRSDERALHLHQDVELYRSTLSAGAVVGYELAPGRLGWLQVARGALTVNGQAMTQGDGLALTGSLALRIEGNTEAEFLLFDMTSTGRPT
jgi:redox-sensitive bicupin YhaK (pirin superfamily)